MSASESQPNRRVFAQALAAAAVTPLLIPSERTEAQTAADPAAVVQSLTDLARARFGKHLTEEQIKDVRRGIARGQRGAELLRQVKLQNSDEPAVVFRADAS